MKKNSIDKFYVSPVASGPKPNAVNGSCWFAKSCKTGFGAVVIVGGAAAVVGAAIACPPSVVVAAVA